MVGRLAYAHRMGTHQSAATAAAVEIEDRFAVVSGEVRDRLASAPRAAFRRMRSRPAPTAGDEVDGYDGYDGDGDAHDELDDYDEDAPPEWADGPADGEVTYPWEPPQEPDPGPSPYLDDVDPTVHNPFPWSPEGTPDRPGRPF
jgi:hypothetical protein